MGNIEWVRVQNQEDGTIGVISRNHFENPSIVKPGLLKEVDADQKPYLPEMFKDRTVPKPEEPETEEAVEAEDEED